MKKKYKTKKIVVIKKIIKKDKKEKKSNKRKSHKRREKAGHDDRESLQNFMETRGRIMEFRNLLENKIGPANFLKYIKIAHERLKSSIIKVQYKKDKPLNSLQERTINAIKISNVLIDLFIKVLNGENLNENEIPLIDTRTIDEYLKNEDKIKLYIEQIKNNTVVDRLGLETAIRGESRRNDFVKESQNHRIKAISRG